MATKRKRWVGLLCVVGGLVSFVLFLSFLFSFLLTSVC